MPDDYLGWHQGKPARATILGGTLDEQGLVPAIATPLDGSQSKLIKHTPAEDIPAGRNHA